MLHCEMVINEMQNISVITLRMTFGVTGQKVIYVTVES